MTYTEMFFGIPLTFKAFTDFFTPTVIKEYEDEILKKHLEWCEKFINSQKNNRKTSFSFSKNHRSMYLETLGLNEMASTQDVKKAYRKMAMQWHPDRNHSPEAEEQFKKVKDAFEHLYGI